MRKLLCAAVAVFCLYSSCQDPLLSTPVVPKGKGPTNTGNPPENVSATHGEKRIITLSWDAAPDAVKYFIYKTDSLFVPFTRCAETTDTRIELTVDPGSTVYYKVSSIFQDNSESQQSEFIMGSSLDQPVITNITDITESGATVTWYMKNVSDATYKNDLRYIVYCFAGSSEVARHELDASQIAENKAVFTGLSAYTPYKFQVEAYLHNDQDRQYSEISELMDAETVRRQRPDAPANFTASRGTSKDSVTLTFDLPATVDVLQAGEYTAHPLYFVISKRLYNEFVDNEYQKICSYFGTNPNKANNGGATFSEYIPGSTVSWTDTSVSRGVEYEYQVQSYVEEKGTSSDSSISNAEVGWAMSAATLSVGTPVYQPNENGTLYVSAELTLHFTFDHKGETYTYTVLETIRPLEDNVPYNPSGVISRESEPLSLEDVIHYAASMDLSGPSTAVSPGRGEYSYQIRISLPDGTPVDTVAAIGSRQISEDVNPVVMDDFFVQDGYTDKFIISWDNYPNRKYLLFASDDPIDWPTEPIAVFNESPLDLPTAEPVMNFEYAVTGQEPGITKYFAMQPVMVTTMGNETVEKRGQWVYADNGSQTMARPSLLQVTGHSYSTVTVLFTEAQKADTYRIKYKYADGVYISAATLDWDKIPREGNNFKYQFPPVGYNDASVAGKEMHITVDALNEGLREAVGGAEIVLSSTEDYSTRLVGPAELTAQASKAASAAHINVSWNRISGADGYYVFRRQFNMNDTAEEGDEAVVYYIPAATSSPIAVTGKNLLLDSSNTKIDAATVKASASYTASRYTLTDTYMTDGDYSGDYSGYTDTYRTQQNDLARGNPYRYFIVPVINRSGYPESPDSIEFAYGKDNITNKNTGVVSYTLQENGENISYSGAAALEKTGFAIGFGQNVKATKGTYAAQNSNANSGIQITWEAPPLLAGAGVTPVYEVWRKAYNAATWDKITTVSNLAYIDPDTSVTKGVTYEYLIGISNGSSVSEPTKSARFIASCCGTTDEKGRPGILGYMLEMVKMQSVSREEQTVNGNFAEEVKWYSAGVKNTYSNDYSWGIDGYTVFVMNRNIDAGWHEIADISSNIPNQTNQSVKVAANTKFSAEGRDLLRVMRDYKHYFKVRSYVLNNGDKVYSPDPAWNYETLFVANRTSQETSNFLETDYVKWGARQITVDEFARIATLPIAWGIHHMRGGSRWNWVVHSYGEKTLNGNNGSSGKVSSEATWSASRWWWNFYNYKPSMDTRANKHPNGFQSGFYGAGDGGWTWQYAVIFLTINTGSRDGRSMIYAGAPSTSNFPDRYGARDNYGVDPFDIIGPPNVNGMYTGKMRFDNYQLNSDSQTAGSMRVRYPASAAEVTGVGQYNVALPYVVFQSRDPAIRFEYDEWF